MKPSMKSALRRLSKRSKTSRERALSQPDWASNPALAVRLGSGRKLGVLIFLLRDRKNHHRQDHKHRGLGIFPTNFPSPKMGKKIWAYYIYISYLVV